MWHRVIHRERIENYRASHVKWLLSIFNKLLLKFFSGLKQNLSLFYDKNHWIYTIHMPSIDTIDRNIMNKMIPELNI